MVLYEILWHGADARRVLMEAFSMRATQKHVGLILIFAMLLLIFGVQGALAEAGQISGMVWVDKTPDGVIAGNEGGLSGARVTLETKDAEGKSQVAKNATASKSGEFLFDGLAAGEYRLRVEVSKEYHFTLHGKDSAVLPAQGNASYTPWFTLGEGESRKVNAGATKSACLVSVIAFEDANVNGGRMETEPTVRGVPVQVVYEYEGETYVVASDNTDRSGLAVMRDLSPATYRVRAVYPEHYTAGPVGQKMNTYYNCLAADENNVGLSEPFTLAAKESLGLGIGVVRTGSLAGKVWFDANYNGKWDGEEAGLTGAEITLHFIETGLKRTMQPDEKGDYRFDILQPGDYLLQFALPEGMIFTYPGQSKLSDTANTGALNVYVKVDVTTDVGAVGAMPAAGLTLTLYADMNLNGVRDGDEPLLSGAAVTAAQGGKTVEKTETDENGEAVFNALRGGETQITAALPEGWLFRADEVGLFAVSGIQNTAQAEIILDGLQPDAQHEAAVIPASAVSGMLFEDAANTGLMRQDSRPLSGFTVQAVAPNGDILAEAVTDESGAYTLYPLSADAYTVRFLLRDAYVASPYAADQEESANRIQAQNPEFGDSEQITLAPGEKRTSFNGSVFQAGLADGRVLVSGVYAEKDTGIPGVTVTLLDADGQPVSDHSYGVTDENGYFFIKGILPGAYSLAYQMPDNGVFTEPSVEGTRYVGESFVSGSGSHFEAAEIRGILTSSIAGKILHDNPAEAGLYNAQLSLRGHTVNYASGIHANPDGSFAFTGLMPDTYTLTVTLPQGLVFGEKEGAVISRSRSEQASAEITLALGEKRLDTDILAVTPVSLSGVVYYDDNLSAEMDEEEYGAESRSLTLWENGEQLEALETDENGGFVFEGLIPGSYELHIDLDENEDLVDVANVTRGNEDEILPVAVLQDARLSLPVMRYASVAGQVWSLGGGEGMSGVNVSLLNSEGEALAETASGESGEFEFGRLLPGTYALAATLPEGYLFARAQDTGARDSFIQSQVDGTVVAIPFEVITGDDMSGVDIGVGTMGRIGDRAWLDVNGNGMQDMDEPSMPGIVIELYQHGELVASTVTDAYGRYGMDNLYPGEYEMRVTMHKELKATVHQTDFPLVASILPESDELTVTVSGVIVPSGRANLHCDLGFQLRKKNVYPAAMDDIPVKDWRPYSER